MIFDFIAMYFLIPCFGLITLISWKVHNSSVQNKLVKSNLLAVLIYSVFLFATMVLIEKKWQGTSDEHGWADLIPGIFFMVWLIAFTIHLLIVWIVMEVRAESPFKKSK
ncbi:MAG: hypothetical protein ABIQ40_18190 [Bacteroidia bacterium]